MNQLGHVDILILLSRETLKSLEKLPETEFFLENSVSFLGFTSVNRFMSLYYLVTMKCPTSRLIKMPQNQLKINAFWTGEICNISQYGIGIIAQVAGLC